ncbi:MAG: metallophosphoesterase [Candidatus Cloacimonetes bacterium]|nr:metallophosphoesterase [Candidatus Cloacimonadota bacterium]
MNKCIFATDLHGKTERYDKLFKSITEIKPSIIFLGGDLTPHNYLCSGKNQNDSFLENYLKEKLSQLKLSMNVNYPTIYTILGNDDLRIEEIKLVELEKAGLLKYVNERKCKYEEYSIFGLAYVPPTPFQLKDWERYDVSTYTDLGCISPDLGYRTVDISETEISYRTISRIINDLTGEDDLSKSVFLFHSPPYQTNLDRAALDGIKVDGVQLDLHVGSIAIKNFIEEKQPYLTLHGHIHESSSITGSWKQKIGNTLAINAAYEKEQLSIVVFTLENCSDAKRYLL